MKKILFILASVISLNCFAQDKIVKIPQSELDAFFLAVDTLQYQDSIKTVLIADLEKQLLFKTNLEFTNKTILLNQEYEIEMLNDQIKLYADRLKITDKWYNKRWFGIVIGVAGTSTAIYLAGQL
jgi:hypothetical protein|tara:strand:- start:448 stop:822 length:375 start_codon:yes stop_codon:yes gene_type:complete